MKIFALALAVATSAALITTPASAVDVHVGPGGVHVDRHHHHWRGAYDYSPGGCRVVITKRINGAGERVTVRKRICD